MSNSSRSRFRPKGSRDQPEYRSESLPFSEAIPLVLRWCLGRVMSWGLKSQDTLLQRPGLICESRESLPGGAGDSGKGAWPEAPDGQDTRCRADARREQVSKNFVPIFIDVPWCQSSEPVWVSRDNLGLPCNCVDGCPFNALALLPVSSQSLFSITVSTDQDRQGRSSLC